jgi:hypothetical protein
VRAQERGGTHSPTEIHMLSPRSKRGLDLKTSPDVPSGPHLFLSS